MKAAIILVVGLIVVSVLPACIEFEKQTILMKLDTEKDVLKARLVYQGIYSGGEDVAKDLKELTDVGEGGTRFFLLDNWPLAVDLARPEKGEADKPVVAMMRAQTTLTNGTFFLDDEGKLSAWQDIEIKDVSKLLVSANRLLNLAILTGKADPLDDADDKTKELCKSLALAGHEWVKLDGDGLRFVFAASAADATKLKLNILDEIVKQAKKSYRENERAETKAAGEDEDEKDHGSVDDLEVIIRYIARNDFSWIHRGHELTLGLAPNEKGVIRLNCWNESGYEPNLLKPAKEGEAAPKLPAKIDETVKLEKLLDL